MYKNYYLFPDHHPRGRFQLADRVLSNRPIKKLSKYRKPIKRIKQKHFGQPVLVVVGQGSFINRVKTHRIGGIEIDNFAQ